jgi:hypothetical protein
MNLNKIIFLFILVPSLAYADLHIEPHYSWQSGTFDDATNKGSFSADVYGIKIGYIENHFYAGLSFDIGEYSFDRNFSTYNTELYKGGGIGTYLGFYWGSIKVWTNYINSTLEPQNMKSQRFFGEQLNFGFGFKLSGSFYLNYEIFSNQFTQLENDVTGKTNGLANNIKTNGESLSLSIQWAIF